MALTGSMQLAMKFPTCGYQHHVKGLWGSISSNSTQIISCNQSYFKHHNLKMRGQLCLLESKLSSVSLKQYSRSMGIPNRFVKRPYYLQCQCSQNSSLYLDATFVKNGTLNLAWSCKNWQGSPVIVKLALAVGVAIFILCKLGPVVRLSKSICQNKRDNSWKKVSTYHVAISYILCLFIWVGAMFVFRELDLVVPPTEAGKSVKLLLHFVRSMSTALTFSLSASSLYPQTQKFMEIDAAVDTRKMVTQVVVDFLYYFMRLVATSSIMEFYGCFSFTETNTGDLFKLTFLTLVGEEIWKINKANASALTSKDYASTLTTKDDVSTLTTKDDASTLTSKDDALTLTSKDDAAAIRNPSTAAEDALLVSLISLDGISKQLKDITRQTSAGGAHNKLFLASLEGLRGQISSVLDNPCGQSCIIEAQCAASSTSEEED